MKLQDKIKELCRARKKTIKDLATDIDMTEVGFHQSMQRNTLKVTTLEKVAAVLGVPITYFFEEEEKNDDRKGAGPKSQIKSKNKVMLLIEVDNGDQDLLKRKALDFLRK